ncbi:MAG: IS982 family transposase [SAR324 cluster bacterium]|nr:IS982 family transposase [SAR324 cluster bacterium]
MDWQARLIALFVYISNHYDDYLWTYCQRLSPNARPEFSDPELMTVYLWGVSRGYQEIQAIHDYTHDHLLDWFPKLPAYATYIQRLNRIAEVFVPLIHQIQQDFPRMEGVEMIRLIDSMPIMMAKAQRSGTAKVAPELANKGYNSTKDTYYYGVKLHILAFRRQGQLPLPDYLGMTSASEADINVLKALAEDIHDTPVYADKAYINEALSQLLAQQGASLNTPVKKAKGQKDLFLFQAAFSTLVSQVRQPIESLFNWIQEKTGIQVASKVRSSQGLMVHVFGKIAAAMFLLTANF